METTKTIIAKGTGSIIASCKSSVAKNCDGQRQLFDMPVNGIDVELFFNETDCKQEKVSKHKGRI